MIQKEDYMEREDDLKLTRKVIYFREKTASVFSPTTKYTLHILQKKEVTIQKCAKHK